MVIAVVVAVVVSSGGDDATTATTKFETADVTTDVTPLPRYDSATYSRNRKDPAIGMTMPTLHGKSVFDGKPVTIAPNGKPQAIVFVAHWCPHCQAEVPRLVALAKQGVFKGLEVTAVATGTSDNYLELPAVGLVEEGGLAVPGDGRQRVGAPVRGLNLAARFMKSVQIGKAAWDPDRFSSRLSSNPTQTMQSRSGV